MDKTNNLSLMQMFSHTPYDSFRSVKMDEGKLQELLIDNKYKEGLTEDLRSQTSARNQKTPYEVLKMQQETDPSMFSSDRDTKLSSNTLLQKQNKFAVDKVSDEELTYGVTKTIDALLPIIIGAEQVLQQSGNTALVKSWALDAIKKDSRFSEPDKKRTMEMIQNLPDTSPEEAAAYLQKSMEGLQQAKLNVDTEEIRKQARHKEAMELRKLEIDKSEKNKPLLQLYADAVKSGDTASAEMYKQALQGVTPGFFGSEKVEGVKIGKDDQGRVSIENRTSNTKVPPQGQQSQQATEGLTPQQQAQAEIARRKAPPPAARGNGQPVEQRPAAGMSTPASEGPSGMQSAPPSRSSLPVPESDANTDLNRWMNLEPRQGENTNAKYHQRLLYENYQPLKQYFLKNYETLPPHQRNQIYDTLKRVEEGIKGTAYRKGIDSDLKRLGKNADGLQ